METKPTSLQAEFSDFFESEEDRQIRLKQEAQESDFEYISGKLVEQALNAFSERLEQRTYGGISLESLKSCLTSEPSAVLNWQHVSLTLDINTLKDISGDKILELDIPNFVEELRPCEIDSGFGFNNTGRNFVKSIHINKNILLLSPNIFALYKRLESVIFENNCRLLLIGDRAFAYCENLHTLDLRNCERLETLPDDLIAYSGVEILKFSKKITELEPNVFRNSNLKTIYIEQEKYSYAEFLYQLELNNNQPFWIEQQFNEEDYSF